MPASTVPKPRFSGWIRHRLGVIVAALALMLGIGVIPAETASAETPVNYGSTYAVPYTMFTPDSDGYTHYSNNDGSWTNCGPSYCTVYLSRSATQALYSDAQTWGMSPTMKESVTQVCQYSVGAGTAAAAKYGWPALTATELGGFGIFVAGAVGVGAGVALCASALYGSPPPDLVAAAQSGGCFQETPYGAPAGHTNNEDYCYFE